MDMAAIEKIGSELRRLKKDYPAKLRERDQEGGRFEQQACAIVHRTLANCDPTALADHEFWIWLAVVQYADIVEWRFGTTGRHAKLPATLRRSLVEEKSHETIRALLLTAGAQGRFEATDVEAKAIDGRMVEIGVNNREQPIVQKAGFSKDKV